MKCVADPLADQAIEEIPRVDTLSRADFVRQYLRPGKPVVIRVADGNFWTMERLLAALGDREVSALRTDGGNLRTSPEAGVHFQRIRLDEVTRALADGADPGWHVSVPLTEMPAAFTDNMPPPVYCADAPFLRSRVWLAAPGTVTPLHWDMPRNFLQLAFGHRRVLLYPPLDGLHVYPNAPTSKMPNFSRFDPENPDFEAFRSAQRARPVRGIIGPGEAMYIPPGWWHHVRSLDTSLAVNFWWGNRVIAAAWRAAQSYKGLRGLYRREWK